MVPYSVRSGSNTGSVRCGCHRALKFDADIGFPGFGLHLINAGRYNISVFTKLYSVQMLDRRVLSIQTMHERGVLSFWNSCPGGVSA